MACLLRFIWLRRLILLEPILTSISWLYYHEYVMCTPSRPIKLEFKNAPATCYILFAMADSQLNAKPEDRYSTAELLRRLLRLAWQFRGDCLLSLVLSIVRAAALGLIGLQLFWAS